MFKGRKKAWRDEKSLDFGVDGQRNAPKNIQKRPHTNWKKEVLSGAPKHAFQALFCALQYHFGGFILPSTPLFCLKIALKRLFFIIEKVVYFNLLK